MENMSQGVCNRCSKFDFEAVFDMGFYPTPAMGEFRRQRLLNRIGWLNDWIVPAGSRPDDCCEVTFVLITPSLGR